VTGVPLNSIGELSAFAGPIQVWHMKIVSPVAASVERGLGSQTQLAGNLIEGVGEGAYIGDGA
jgi:hypothetical protein